MPIVSHPYAGPTDFERLRTFLSDARANIDQAHYLHMGDLAWQLFHMLSGFATSDIVHLWEEEPGQVVGFVLVYPSAGFFDLQVAAPYSGGTVEAEMLAWAEMRLASLRPPQERNRDYYTLVHESDLARVTLLEGQGYMRGDPWLYLERAQDEAVPAMKLPSGFIVRPVQGEGEATARAAVLGAAFGAPPQPERYRQFMRAPGYTGDLDLVAVAPDGRFAAFAMCWVDTANKVGQFEPVGADPSFRRQGLARAVLLEGLRRMQAHGAERAIVVVEEAEQAARQLYESVGLKPRWKLYLYSKHSD
jgi:ribosomal protein S18 acetylase RimI-like enzyme